jgi:ABC-type transporter Mla subunit MlaD
MADKRTDTATLIQAMRILARDIQSDDGVANAAIAEAADRLEEQAATLLLIAHNLDALAAGMRARRDKLTRDLAATREEAEGTHAD